MSSWMVWADDVLRPVEDLNKERAAPPPNPTGDPVQKPMPLAELLKLMETAAKALLDGGLDLEKSGAALSKVRSMGGATEDERKIMAKAGEMASKVSELKDAASAMAADLSAWRESLSAGTPTAKRRSRWFGR